MRNLPRRIALVLAMTVCLFANHIAQARGTFGNNREPPDALSQMLSPDPESQVPKENVFGSPAVNDLKQAMARGLWSRGCALATNILANQEPDVNALGVFSVCAAIRNNRSVADTALKRLTEVETSPEHYDLLTKAILSMRANQLDAAAADFNTLFNAHPEGPHALYFLGTLDRARHKDGDALAHFKAVLQTWPDYAPALVAIAQLTTARNADKASLDAAIAMLEHATAIEPMNRAYWAEMAELCERSGQHDRAKAIRLQWLTFPVPH